VSRVSQAVESVTLAAIDGFAGAPHFDGIPRVLASLADAVGVEVAGFYAHEWDGRTTPVHIYPDATITRHPDRPFVATKVVGGELWREFPVARILQPDWGRHYEFAIPVAPSADERVTHVWALGRTGIEFHGADREVCEALVPVLRAVTAHYRALSRWQLTTVETDVLTQREVLVLQLHAHGVTARGVAIQLGMSTRTAQKHTEHIYQKLGVHSRDQAVRACADAGIVLD
jgi:DNA-binding CsgD family transcriptional regulator